MAVMMPPAYVSSPPPAPKHFREYYFSAPTSPSHLSDLYLNNNGDEFAFDVSEDVETASLSAEELFDGGVIKPMTPPPRLQLSPANGNRKDTSSPRHKDKEMEPDVAQNAVKAAAPPQRGRKRGKNLSLTPSRRRAARSLSPIRDTQNSWEEEEEYEQNDQNKITKNSLVCSTLAAYKKWRLKDFFLFRSASEGRAADKDPLKKYTASFRRSSFRETDIPGSASGSRRRGPVSAHELHYTVNRAVSEDLKKKTFLPYKQGILGRLAFNPAVHALANGFGISRK